MSKTTQERFDEKYVVADNGCWEWTAGSDPKGYGRFAYEGSTKAAHRYAAKHLAGLNINEKLVCHTCDNPGCVNPEHLFVGTHQDNTDDMHAKRRWVKPCVCPGTHNGRAKITEADIPGIRASLKNRNALATKHGVTPQAIDQIRARKTWRHVA